MINILIIKDAKIRLSCHEILRLNEKRQRERITWIMKVRKSRTDEGEKIILVEVFIFAPLENESQHVAI